MKNKEKYPSSSRRSLPKESEEECQDEADDDAGRNREIEAEPLPLDVDIAGELPEPGDLVRQGQEQT